MLLPKAGGRTPLATFNHRTTLEMHGGVRRISSDIVVDQRSEPTYYTYTLALVMNFNSILVKTKLFRGLPTARSRLHELDEAGFLQELIAQAALKHSMKASASAVRGHW